MLPWLTGQSGVHRTCPVNYSGANSRSWRVPESLFPGAPDTVRCTLDSPVNYSGAPLDFPEGDEFELESSSAPDTVRWCTEHCPVRHRTLSCVPATSPGRWFPTIGALTAGPAWMSGGTPDMYCRVSGVPARACLTSARFWSALNAPAGDRWREVVVAPLAHRTVR